MALARLSLKDIVNIVLIFDLEQAENDKNMEMHKIASEMEANQSATSQ